MHYIFVLLERLVRLKFTIDFIAMEWKEMEGNEMEVYVKCAIYVFFPTAFF